MKYWFFQRLVGFGAVLVFVGCSAELPTSSPSVEQGRSIIEGQPASEKQFASALRITTDIRYCSATKLGKRVAITSAQCMTKKAGFKASDVETFVVSATGLAPAKHGYEFHEVDHLTIHPGYDKYLAMDKAERNALSDEQIGATVLDIAIIVTKDNLPGEIVELDFEPVRVADRVLAAGFGCKEKDGRELQALHFATKQINGVLGLSFFLPPENHLSELKSINCGGDSGGGVYRLVKKLDGTVAPGALVGVSKMNLKGHWMISGIANDWVKSVLSKLDR